MLTVAYHCIQSLMKHVHTYERESSSSMDLVQAVKEEVQLRQCDMRAASQHAHRVPALPQQYQDCCESIAGRRGCMLFAYIAAVAAASMHRSHAVKACTVRHEN